MSRRDPAVPDVGGTPCGPITWVMEEDGLNFLEEQVAIASEVVWDLETTSLDEYATSNGPWNGGVAARIVLLSVTLPQADDHGMWDGEDPTTWLVPLSHPDSPFLGRWRATMRRIAQTFQRFGKPLVGHNQKFDARYTHATTGVDLTGLLRWDTMVSSHLLDETRRTRLKVRAAETFGIEEWDDFDLSYPGAAEDVPLFQLGDYAALDTYMTWKLLRHHREQMWLAREPGEEPMSPEEILDARLGRLATWTAMPTAAALTVMEQRGIRLDEEYTRRHVGESTEIVSETLEKMAARYGMPLKGASTAPTSGWFKEWTGRAVEDGDLRIMNLTGKGVPQWSRGVLNKQARQGSEAAQLVLDERKHRKRLEYLNSWLHEAHDGIIHANYNIGSVSSGRLSSSGPNMQQVTKPLRPCFIPRDGYVIADIDHSQIELRVAAFISRSEPMIEAFRRGDDLHRIMAAQITGKAPEDVTPEERQQGKAADFGLLFGMGPGGFKAYAETVYGVVMTSQQAQDAYQAFFDTWTGMREWHQRAAARVHTDGFVVSPLGRVRRLHRQAAGDDKSQAFAERAAINSPVQSFASDLMQMGAASILGVLPGTEPVPNVYMVATVHDSIVVEVPEGNWQESVAACQDRMTNLDEVLYRLGVRFDVPLVAEADVGSRWGLDDISNTEAAM